MTQQPTLSTLQRFFRILHTDRKEIGYIYVYAIFAGLINLSLPLGIQAILNILQGGAVSSSWWLLIAAVTLGTLFAGLLVVMQMTVSETLQRRLFTRVSFDFAKRLPKLHTEAVRKEYLPEVANRFFDTLTLQKGLPKMLIDLSTALMQIIFGLLLLSFYHPLFIFFGFLLLVLLILIFRFTGPIGLKTSLSESKYKFNVAYWLEEIARTLQTFKLAGTSDLPLKKTDDYVSNYLDAKRSHFRILLIQYASVVGFKTLITFTLLSLGGWLVINNQINVGQFVAAEIIIILILNSAEKMIVTMDTVYDVLTAIEKIGAVTDIPIENENGVDFAQMNTGQGIKLDIKNLNYNFGDNSKSVLQGINLSVASGEKLCIAGYNSSGKTTLIQIISCFFSDFKGEVLYNGVPRKNFNQTSLRHAIGDYSAQEDVFKGTIKENIALGYGHIRFDDLVKTCEAVGLMGFIGSLPEGFDTLLLPAGKTLPRSVISKIILARGILTNPQLLAIEEVMANLEYADRIRVADLLTDRAQKWTLVAVTNDPILASRCDRIVLMKGGQIIEEGNYEQIQKSFHFEKIFRI